MSNRRVKDIEFDDDGYDDYEENYDEEGAEELTEDDKFQLQEGTAKVKSLLSSDVTVTNRQIQDALWHYFYDVEKSVAFLKNVKKPKPTQPKAKAAAPITNDPPPMLPMIPDWLSAFQFSGDTMDFFQDISWGNVPADRLAVITHEKRVPKGGLLGGSSKLAALAAARKKKEAEKAAAAEVSSAERSVDLLDRLGKVNLSGSDQSSQPKAVGFTSRQKRQAVPEPEQTSKLQKTEEAPQIQREDLRGRPSVFAETLFGAAESQAQEGVQLETEESTNGDSASGNSSFKLPYMSDPTFADGAPFTKPSPDDVVLRAQTQGKGL